MLRHQEPYCIFYNMLGVCPNNIELYKQACRHRSATDRTENKDNNERLEFLGDAILSAIVSDIIYNTYNIQKEGFLSKTRSKIVQRETLNRVATELGLDKIVELKAQLQSHNNYTYGNALEAIIGALYLDQGFDTCKKIVEKNIINKHIDIDTLAHNEVNFKSKLIEWCQHHHFPYHFDIDNISADEHKNPIFHARVYVIDRELGEGTGYSKKEAQQKAAQAAIKFIKKQKHFASTLHERLSTLEPNTQEPSATRPCDENKEEC